jgi:hypothetical protein
LIAPGIIVGVGFKATATNDSVQPGTKSSNIKYPPSMTEKENISSQKNELVQQQQQQQSASIVTGTVSRRNETSPYQNNPAPAYQKQQSQVNPSPGVDKVAESSQSGHRLVHSVIVSSRTNEIERNKGIEVTESAQTPRSITKIQPEFRQTQSSPSLLGSVKE